MAPYNHSFALQSFLNQVSYSSLAEQVVIMLLERNSILRKWFSGQNTGALSATADYAQGTGCTPGATSRVRPRRVRGWLISTPGAIVLNHISFPSQ